MKIYFIWLGEQNELGCILCNHEYFSEFKMAVSAILNFGKFSTFDLDDIEGRVIPLLWVFQDGESISEVIFWIRGQCQGQVRDQRLKNVLVQPLAFLRMHVYIKEIKYESIYTVYNKEIKSIFIYHRHLSPIHRLRHPSAS